ncbi:sulfite exporter TauE/SafE family protein [Moraxella sp.]|uniref:sulfite exporter TauE/SafE family protein n=1 Tax=Moraxella sp. TaxID=479 RepID=UPI0026DAD0CF|nr:sulfite exporter TauE/SafE family protein [Moraxella sp.]MDO4894049.1 sulfite exporter TauE/SafE family protein [Moraxella sp.]
MNSTLIFAALAMGFFGSPHCLGMCGGIVTAFGISMHKLSPTRRRLLIAGYHLGRLASYLILGVIAALFGKHLLAPLMADNNLPRYLLGGALVFVGLMMLGLPVLNQLEKLGLSLWNALAPIRAKVLPMNTLPKALMAGLLWGFLPCGMVYGALGMAISLSVSEYIGLTAAIFMAFFWLGTLPMLLATGTVMNFLHQKISRLHLRAVSGVILIISGLLAAFSMPLMHSLHGGHSHHAHHASHEHHADGDNADHDMHDHHQHHSH